MIILHGGGSETCSGRRRESEKQPTPGAPDDFRQTGLGDRPLPPRGSYDILRCGLRCCLRVRRPLELLPSASLRRNRAITPRKTMPRIPIAQTSKLFAPNPSTIYRYSTLNPPNRPSILKAGQAGLPRGSACHRAKLGHASNLYVNPSSN